MSRKRMTVDMLIERPERPAEIRITAAIDIPRAEREYALTFLDQASIQSWVLAKKHQLASRLVGHLMAKTKLFSDELILEGGERVSLEIVLNDRGTYRHWLPEERREGQAEGRKAGRQDALAALPYGMSPEDQEPI